MSKQIHIIAGPNGAGKTSHARVALLPDFLGSNEFVNADEIAKILSPGNPEKSAIKASRLMLKRMEFLLASSMSFALETTLSAKTYVNFIEKVQSAGYKVNLIFMKLESAELARIRVGVRVNKGGLNIEPEVIECRFRRGLDNLKIYLDIVDTASVYEASGHDLVEIDTKSEGQLKILNEKFWREIYGQ